MKIQLPSFTTKGELLAYLIANKEDLAELKKSELKRADAFGFAVTDGVVTKDATAGSSDTDSEILRTIVGNTYFWMDSHDDVHLANCFAKSISERKNKVWHLHDHLHQITAKVGIPQKIYEAYIDWTRLGVNKAGQTQALLADTLIQKELNPQVFKGYKDGEINQHSVGMQYVKIELCVNDPEYKQEFANWQACIDLVGNREKAEEKGYFWAVKEAKLIEISCVLEGSNELTRTLPVEGKNADNEPDNSVFILTIDDGKIKRKNEGQENRTPEEPLQSTPSEPQAKFDLSDAIKNTTFF